MVATTSSLVALSPLETAVLAAVREAGFDEVLDAGPANEDRPIPPGSDTRIALTPNVDVVVIQLDADGRMLACANVLLSQDYPEGQVVPVDSNTSASAVRFLRWDIDRWNGGTFEPGTGQQLTEKGWTNNPPLTSTDDLVSGRTNATLQFMAPYPASLFKVMVAFHIARMVDAGVVTLDTPITYSEPNAEDETRAIRDWMNPMITVSDNRATRALLQMLHQRDHMEALNRELRELGLDTLQINGTRASDGYNWQPGQIHMTALDTARLFWLIDGPPDELWRTPDNKPVTADFLSDTSRKYLKQLLVDPGLKKAPPNSNRAEVKNEADVTFAHKRGMTYNYGSDAGIVTSLPGRPFRHYVIAILTNLGYRYADEPFTARTSGLDESPVEYTKRIPGLLLAIDDAVTTLSTQHP